jgi:hypothetical protein
MYYVNLLILVLKLVPYLFYVELFQFHDIYV